MPVELSIVRRLATPPTRRLGRALPATAWFKANLRQVLTMENVGSGAWSVALVDDGTMTQLHGQTMGIFTTTDVLTFDLRMPPSGKNRPLTATPAPSAAPFLGRSGRTPLHRGTHIELDTVVCLDEAARQAAVRGHELQHEILLYAVHSLLHLCGYDDHAPADSRRMHRREDQILVALGVGAVFERPLNR